MTSPLAGSLARQLGRALKPMMLPMTLRRVTTGPYDPATGTTSAVETDYPCKGYVDSYNRQLEAAQLVQANDRKVLILSSTLDATPSLSDKLVIDSVSYTIHHISRDAAGATWTLQARA